MGRNKSKILAGLQVGVGRIYLDLIIRADGEFYNTQRNDFHQVIKVIQRVTFKNLQILNN